VIPTRSQAFHTRAALPTASWINSRAMLQPSRPVSRPLPPPDHVRRFEAPKVRTSLSFWATVAAIVSACTSSPAERRTSVKDLPMTTTFARSSTLLSADHSETCGTTIGRSLHHEERRSTADGSRHRPSGSGQAAAGCCGGCCLFSPPGPQTPRGRRPTRGPTKRPLAQGPGTRSHPVQTAPTLRRRNMAEISGLGVRSPKRGRTLGCRPAGRPSTDDRFAGTGYRRRATGSLTDTLGFKVLVAAACRVFPACAEPFFRGHAERVAPCARRRAVL